MKKIKELLVSILVIVVIFGMGFGSGIYWWNKANTTDAKVVEKSDDDGIDLQLPGEVEKVVVTAYEIEGKLEQLNEWSTYSGIYTVSKTEEFTRHMLDDIAVPGTTNTVSINCDVVVKVGYNVDDIGIEIDDESSTLYIALPEIIITDQYIVLETLECNEDNNILNPIDYDEYQGMFEEIVADGVTQAEEDGIYANALENAQNLVTLTLAVFSDYEIVFM